MKIKINEFNLEGFSFKEGDFCNLPSILITPSNINSKFFQNNKIFRSSIWSKDGELLSASFPKFKNAGEDADNFPLPKSISECNVVVKEDGSTCIIDYVNGQLSMRTRGVMSYKTLHNYKDFEFCLDKYPKIKACAMLNSNVSLLFEIVTPNQRIVLNYGDEPDLILIGAINKKDYSLISQKDLDKLSEAIGVRRPKYYKFDSFEEISRFLESNKEIEGFCSYFDNDQSIVKWKTSHYLALHKIFTGMRSIGNVLDVFMESPRFTKYSDFYSYIETTIDYELAITIKDDILKITTSYCKVLSKLEQVKHLVDGVREGFDRKSQALQITQHWNDWRKFAGFQILDNKPIDDKLLRKAIEENIN